jgi:preprotein translocase subunit SecE
LVSAEPHDDGADELGVEQVGRQTGLVPEPRRESTGSRLVGFARGSWRELQRVAWPDRRQVMQATGVVLGVVIVAGVFLGVADLAASKLVNFILK